MTEFKKLSLATLAGLIIGLLTAYGAYSLFKTSAKEKFAFSGLIERFQSGTVKVDSAAKSLKNYRHPDALLALYDNWEGKIYGVAHNKREYDSLYHLAFERFVASHTPPIGFDWQLGLYPNVTDNSGSNTNPRLNIYFIPTLVSKDNIAQDFYTLYKKAGNKDPYSQYLKKEKDTDWTDDDNYIFDQGTLFP